MSGRTLMGAAMAVAMAGAVAAPVALAAEEQDATRLTLRDTRYVVPLAPPAVSPECFLVLCPAARPLPAVGSGPDAGSAGVSVTGMAFAPAGVVAEARSEPFPYDGASEDGTAKLSLSAARVAEGRGATVTTGVRLEEVGGRTVAELAPSTVPLDGARRTVGPVALSPSALTPGRSYVAVARFVLSAPSGSSVTARVFAPELLALGPPRKKAVAPLRVGAPRARLSGRRLRVSARCPSGSFRCELRVRSALAGRTLGKGSVELQAGAGKTFEFVLSGAELRRARRVGRITTKLEVEDETRRTAVARSVLRLPL